MTLNRFIVDTFRKNMKVVYFLPILVLLVFAPMNAFGTFKIGSYIENDKLIQGPVIEISPYGTLEELLDSTNPHEPWRVKTPLVYSVPSWTLQIDVWYEMGLIDLDTYWNAQEYLIDSGIAVQKSMKP